MSRHISYSEISSFRQCPHQHDLAYRQRWTRSEVSPALSTGRLFHEVMAAHYRLSGGIEVEIDCLGVNDLLYAPDGTQDETQVLVEWMYDGFCELYGNDAEWEILAVEKTYEFNLPVPGGRRHSPIKLKMIVDQIRRNRVTGQLWLWDFKTGKRFPNELGLDLDDQFSLYQWGLAQEGIDIFATMYDFARTQRNKGPMSLDERFVRIPVFRTEQQLLSTAEDAWRTAKRISALNHSDPERATNSELCVRRCSYTEACLAGRKGLNEIAFLESNGYVKRGDRHEDEIAAIASCKTSETEDL